jgi:hypothetical protein
MSILKVPNSGYNEENYLIKRISYSVVSPKFNGWNFGLSNNVKEF